MADSQKTMYVYADWNGTAPALIGRLYSGISRGKELFSFEYEEQWLSESD